MPFHDHILLLNQNNEKCSAMGPKASAGKNDNAAMMAMTANTMTPNVSVSVFRVPALSGTYFLPASMPAMAMGPIMGRNRDNSMTIPSAIFQKWVLAFIPPNSEPLLAEAELNSYSISENPWYPGLVSQLSI